MHAVGEINEGLWVLSPVMGSEIQKFSMIVKKKVISCKYGSSLRSPSEGPSFQHTCGSAIMKLYIIYLYN